LYPKYAGGAADVRLYSISRSRRSPCRDRPIMGCRFPPGV
jgi:hypothetical protein